jgi:polysaccharide pyruvyl transferase WcaK-like protein
MVNILIAENIPGLNKGEVAILDGMLESFKMLGDSKVSMLSLIPEIDSSRHLSKSKVIDINCLYPGLKFNNNNMFASFIIMFKHLLFILLYKIIGLKVLNIFKADIWKAYVEADVIIIGHDASFGVGGGLVIPITFYPLYMPFVAKILGKKTVLYAGAVNKITRYHLLLRAGYKFAFKNFDLVTFREEYSYQYVKSLKIEHINMKVTADIAFLSKPAEDDKVNNIKRIENINESDRPLVGITVTRDIAEKAFPKLCKSESYEEHNRIFANLIDYLTKTINARIVFLPHCIGYGMELDDRIVAKDIFQKCINNTNIKIIENEYDADELKGLLGLCSIVIGERIHSVINALSMNVPSIAIVNRKDLRKGIIEMVGQGDKIILVDELTEEIFKSKVLYVHEHRHEINKELKIQIEKMKKRSLLNSIMLKELLHL